MILAYVTLPYRYYEFSDHNYYSTLLPADALEQRVDGVSAIFGIPKRTILDAHFQHNRQWAQLSKCTKSPIIAEESNPRMAKVSRGTFEEDTLFFRNVKHLGLRMPRRMPTESYHREHEKVREIILSCGKLVSLDLYLDKLGGKAKDYYKELARKVVLEAEMDANGSRSIRLCVVKKGGSVEQLK